MEKKQEERRKKKKYRQAYTDLLSLVGSIKDLKGPKDVSVSHDKYIGDFYYEQIRKNYKKLTLKS